MLEMTQPLTDATTAGLRAALDAFDAAGVPHTAIVSTKRRRGGDLTALIAKWAPATETDEPQAPATG